MMTESSDALTIPQNIAIDSKPSGLLRLLFLRHAWALAARPDVPDPSQAPDVGETVRPNNVTTPELNNEWSQLWDARIDWYSQYGAEQPRSHAPMPQWGNMTASDEGIDLAVFDQWSWPLREHSGSSRPEDAVAESLSEAYASGLRSITVLPVVGEYVQWPTTSGLIVSEPIRADQARYAAVLRRSPAPN
ncbi:hypothetical protein [Brevibacterium zhoupengii]|uniref:hypothetical protein n=1 Tax=Brevibacterium zhoupengii TaxID=2898795 RepID=UPI001E3E6F7F|nr:hypothetical protein [Brevibacterium zhoupengii]